MLRLKRLACHSLDRFSRRREKYVAESIRIYEHIVLDCSSKICYCGWRRGKNCHINVVNSQVLRYHVPIFRACTAIQIGVIPSREINRRHESFFHADDRFKQNGSHYWLIYVLTLTVG